MTTDTRRYTEGEMLPDFTYDTAFETGVSFGETVKKADKTALVFLRYYGCTLCQYDIHRLAQEYGKITAAGGQLLVVLQSSRELLAKQLKKDSLPYDIISDPNGELYKMLDIAPAASKAKMADVKTAVKIIKSMSAGYKHGEYEGDELQLPAAFVVDKELHILYAHYGKSAGDAPDADELARIMK